jgi:hypothetical protein
VFPVARSNLRHNPAGFAFFVFSTANPAIAEDVFQEVSKTTGISLKTLRAVPQKNFWAWCYAIALNKLKNQYEEHAADSEQPMLKDEICQFIDLKGQV